MRAGHVDDAGLLQVDAPSWQPVEVEEADADALAQELIAVLQVSPGERGNTDDLRARVRAALTQSEARALIAKRLASALTGRVATLQDDLRWIGFIDEEYDADTGVPKLALSVLSAWFR